MNKDIINLFENMLESWEHITSIDKGVITYDNGLQIIMTNGEWGDDITIQPITLEDIEHATFYNTCVTWSIAQKVNHYIFELKTPYRTYKIPEGSRQDYARRLDDLEFSIQEFEKKKLNEYIAYFNK